MTDNPDDYKTKAEEYENLANAAVDPEEKRKLRDLARTRTQLGPRTGAQARNPRPLHASASREV